MLESSPTLALRPLHHYRTSSQAFIPSRSSISLTCTRRPPGAAHLIHPHLLNALAGLTPTALWIHFTSSALVKRVDGVGPSLLRKSAVAPAARSWRNDTGQSGTATVSSTGAVGHGCFYSKPLTVTSYISRSSGVKSILFAEG